MSIKGKVKNDHSITYTIDFDKPIELNEYTQSLNAFAAEYKKFIREKYGSEQPIDAKLHIEKISEGSIETTLVEYAVVGIPFLQNINTIVEFGKSVKMIYDHFLGRNVGEELPKYDVETLNHLKSIVQPGTDVGNKITIHVQGNDNNVQVLVADDLTASALSDRINKEKKLLESPSLLIHEKQSFYFVQAKKDLSDKKGNYGKIESITSSRLRVIFADEDLKSQMITGEHNPFNTIFIVDVEVQTIKEKPKVYKILALHEIFDDGEEE